MTESEWFASTDPALMLGFVKRMATGRKMRLFAIACCRHVWEILPAEDQAIITIIDQYADGLFDLGRLCRQLRKDNPSLFEDSAFVLTDWVEVRRRLLEQDLLGMYEDKLTEIEKQNDWFPELLVFPDPGVSARLTARRMCELKGWSIPTPPRMPIQQSDFEAWHRSWEEAYCARDIAQKAAADAESAWQAAVLRDLFGSLFRPISMSPSWLSWNDSIVPRLAQSNLEGSRWGDMPILGDALEEAGCDESTILAHLRGPGPHIRGCWALDLILGKE